MFTVYVKMEELEPELGFYEAVIALRKKLAKMIGGVIAGLSAFPAMGNAVLQLSPLQAENPRDCRSSAIQ